MVVDGAALRRKERAFEGGGSGTESSSVFCRFVDLLGGGFGVGFRLGWDSSSAGTGLESRFGAFRLRVEVVGTAGIGSAG